MKVGFIIPLGESPELGRPPSYPEIRALALQAEDAGFDSIWVYDHLLYRFPDQPQRGIWESWSILGPLAEATNRIELGTLVMCTGWRKPALLAKMALTLNEVSQGRLTLGLGAGWHQPEFEAFGYAFDHLESRFEEAVQIIAPLVREGYVDFHGRYYSAPECAMIPNSSRPGGPPILMASRGPRMMRITAQYADAWNAAWVGNAESIAGRRADLEAACTEVGRDPDTIVITAGVHVAYPVGGHTLEDPIDRDKVLTGTPQEVAAALRDFERAGVGQVICGALAHSTYDYASAVMGELAMALRIFRSDGSRRDPSTQR